MNQEQREISGYKINIRRRRGVKRLTLSVKDDQFSLTVAPRTSSLAIKTFIKQNESWLKQHHQPHILIRDGDTIGRHHVVSLQLATKFSRRISNELINIHTPDSENHLGEKVQSFIRKGCIEALRKETRYLIDNRLPAIADQMDLYPKKVTIRNNTSRWGSCSIAKNLNFTVFVAQLPDQLVDYIIIHELAHIAHPNHQAKFWHLVALYDPSFKENRRLLRKQQLKVVPNLELQS